MLLRKLNILSNNLRTVSNCRLVSTSVRVLKDQSNEGDGQEQDGASKLNSLLLSILKEEKLNSANTPKIDLPKARIKQRLKKSKEAVVVKKNLGSQIVDAADTIASQMEGDKKEIEAQLLHKLLFKESTVKEEILKASSGNQVLKDLLSSMDVEQEEKIPLKKTPKEFSRATQVRSLIGKRSINEKIMPRRDQRVNLFGGKPLGIFHPEDTVDSKVELKTWSDCEARERKLSVTNPPANYFEQMIDWTEKGIVWKFPIDNEQGLDDERSVSFASHVLLESQLEGWCPPAGPIRHFMELVCVGLSRNHWLSSAEKEQHIKWYKDFFSQRSQLIKDLGAGDIP